MMEKRVDVTLHINEDMDRDSRERLRDELLHISGVMTADAGNAKSHLMIVEYDPDVVDPAMFIEFAEQRGLHMQLIGM